MPEITHEEQRYQHYEKLLLAGGRVKLEQINTCPHCEKPYKVCMKNGSSWNHCSSEACKFTARREQTKKDQQQKRQRYQVAKQDRPWKHNGSSLSYKKRREYEMYEGFQYA